MTGGDKKVLGLYRCVMLVCVGWTCIFSGEVVAAGIFFATALIITVIRDIERERREAERDGDG